MLSWKRNFKTMTQKKNGQKAEKKIKEALTILNDLGLPTQQQNERSALTLLSLLGLKPADTWEKASGQLMGITPMMDFFRNSTGKNMHRTPVKPSVARRFTSSCRRP